MILQSRRLHSDAFFVCFPRVHADIAGDLTRGKRAMCPTKIHMQLQRTQAEAENRPTPSAKSHILICVVLGCDVACSLIGKGQESPITE